MFGGRDRFRGCVPSSGRKRKRSTAEVQQGQSGVGGAGHVGDEGGWGCHRVASGSRPRRDSRSGGQPPRTKIGFAWRDPWSSAYR